MNRNDPRFDLLEKLRAEPASPELVSELEAVLRSDPEFRREYLRYINLEFHAPAALQSIQGPQPEAEPIPWPRLEQSTPEPASPKPPGKRLGFLGQWRPLAAGILLGMASASWAISQRIHFWIVKSVPIQNADFEKSAGMLPSVFPTGPGLWSGDPTEVAPPPIPVSGSLALHFLSPAGPSAAPGANSCDTYQWVDLRPFHSMLGTNPEADLELSAAFLDTRPQPGTPVRFTAYLFLFQAEPTSGELSRQRLQQETVAMGKKTWVSHGGQPVPEWKTLTARCAFPPEANWALLQISAGRDTRAGTALPDLGQQWADQIQLKLRVPSTSSPQTGKTP
jgi:hypothetical protein